MKIGIAVRRWSPKGGLEQNVLALAKHLLAKGHRITVVAQRIEIEVPGIEIAPIRISPLWPEALKLQRFSLLAQQTLRKIEVEVSFTSGHVAGVDVVRLEGGLSRPYFRARPEAERQSAERAVARIELEKLARAKSILPLSHAAASALEADYGIPSEKIRVVPNGIDLEHHALAASHPPSGIVAFIGSGFERKGLGPLIESLRGTNLTLKVAGEDRQADRHRSRADAAGVKLELLGRVADVRPLLAEADVLALPSLYDPFGLTVLEGLAAGLPVVVTRQVGAAEISPFPELVVDRAEPTLLAAAIRRAQSLASDPATRGIARKAAEAWPIAASFDAVEAALLAARL